MWAVNAGMGTVLLALGVGALSNRITSLVSAGNCGQGDYDDLIIRREDNDVEQHHEVGYEEKRADPKSSFSFGTVYRRKQWRWPLRGDNRVEGAPSGPFT
jgi:hypothetical protein